MSKVSANHLALLIALGGSYISYIYPRSIEYRKLGKISGKYLYVFDIIFHHLPAIYTILEVKPQLHDLLIPLLWLIMFDPSKVYRVSVRTAFGIYTSSLWLAAIIDYKERRNKVCMVNYESG